ncbi:hypothetical protein AB6A40_003794 [Gnathostoma spinigerum]|uniref:Uncharacterized protein n=1 Tax=Gnathostoma spinigerum TaxID=75299 RepID=A0ABD6ELD7_9BILA
MRLLPRNGLFLHLLRTLSSSTQQSTFYDAVIVGGGMVGNAMACLLGQSEAFVSKKILLLEGSDPKPLKKEEVFSNRVSAISPASVAMFKRRHYNMIYS